ncbi:MAG TPA: hypothetical protein VLG74_09355 [Blastocatellia bacterium]|nr:hypothetical protein [Blastocatellia bacterium]
MSSDDLTHNLRDSGEEDNTTQPTITAVFRLLREVKEGQERLNSRLDQVETRIDQVEKGLNSRIDEVGKGFNARLDAHFAELSEQMNSGLLRLSDKLCDRIDRIRLHAEADYEDLLRRLRKLDSKAS